MKHLTPISLVPLQPTLIMSLWNIEFARMGMAMGGEGEEAQEEEDEADEYGEAA